MDEYFTNVIKVLAASIIDKLRGSIFCGIPLDETNRDMLIVMAYELGKHEESLESQKDMDNLFAMLGVRPRHE